MVKPLLYLPAASGSNPKPFYQTSYPSAAVKPLLCVPVALGSNPQEANFLFLILLFSTASSKD